MPLWTRGSESTGTMATSEARIGAAAGSVGNADFEIQSGSERACLERCDTRFHVPLGKALPLLRFLLEHYRGNSTVFLEAEKKVPLTYSRIREVNGAAAAEALFGTKDLLEKSNLTNETEPQETKSNGGDQDCCGQNCSAGAMEAAFCRREDCWCRTLLSLRGSLAIPVNPCSSGSLEAIEEDARKVAAVLRTGSQDHLSLTEGLLTRAILHCQVNVEAGHLDVWPGSKLTDPADELLAREHQAHVKRRFVESVRDMSEEAKRQAVSDAAENAKTNTEDWSSKTVEDTQENSTGVFRPENADVREAEERTCMHFTFRDRKGTLHFREAVAAALGASFWDSDKKEEKEEEVTNGRQRSLETGDTKLAEPLLEQLLFVLWGPADSTFTEEVLACRPSVWRSRLAVCSECSGVKSTCCQRYACKQSCCECCLRVGKEDPSRGHSAAQQTREHSLSDVEERKPEGCGIPAGEKDEELNFVEFFDCTCSRFRSCVIPIADRDVAEYLDEDSLLLPEGAKGGRDSDAESGKKNERLVNYTFAPPATDESDSDDSWNYDPSSSSDEEDSDPDPPQPGSTTVQLPPSAPRRRLTSESETEGRTGVSSTEAENAPSSAAGDSRPTGTSGAVARARKSLHASDSVRHFSKRIERAISLLGDSCVPFVNSVCPTDARWMVSGATFTNRTSAFGSTTASVSTSSSTMAFCCSHAWEVLLLLKSSQHVSDALARPLHGCVDLLVEPATFSNIGDLCTAEPPEGKTGCLRDARAGARHDVSESQSFAGAGGVGNVQKKKEGNETRETLQGRPFQAFSAHAVREFSRVHVALPLWAEGAEPGDSTDPSNLTPVEGRAGSEGEKTSVSRAFKISNEKDEAEEQSIVYPHVAFGAASEWRERVRVLDELSLVETKRLEEGMEFRCFINGGQLLGISQRYLQDYFPFLVNKPQLQVQVKRSIAAFVARAVLGAEANSGKNPVQKKPFLRRFVVDVYVQRKQKREAKSASEELPGRFKCWLLNVLPWGQKTESLLFSWEELRILAYTSRVSGTFLEAQSDISNICAEAELQTFSGGGSGNLELRIIEDPDEADASLRDGTLQLPKELQDIARVAGARGIERGAPSLDDLLYDLQAAHADALRSQKKHGAKEGK
uniref:Uncharacterized protein n=1 Tax=Toxoplasma gondii COUG TaxID=1074873 RepID=A0A2G8Y8J4_TOXGO|nr:hypothetical protein TGCOUG_230580 [Toxoplasma gondii COUG]